MLYNLDLFAPFDTALSYDNPGLIIGSASTEVSRVLFTLDITPAAVRRASETGANLIISHHPVIFDPVKKLSERDIPYLLIKNGIAAVAVHTNLDAADGGVNDVLAKMIGLRNIMPLESDGSEIIGRVGEADVSDIRAFAEAVKNALGADGVEFTGVHRVSVVAVVSGAGGSELDAAEKAGADTFVTGEAKYHQFTEANTRGINLITAGHYDTENIILPPLRDYLVSKLPQMKTEIFNCKFTEKI